jgi:hypothetical protein
MKCRALAVLLAAAACGGGSEAPVAPPPAAGSPTTPAIEPAPRAPAERAVASAAGTYQVTWSSAPDPLPLGEPFAIEIAIARADGGPLAAGARVEIDAGMPQHQHGMNRRPATEELGGGRFRCRDMLFHMPGVWTVTADVTEGPILERAEWTVDLD